MKKTAILVAMAMTLGAASTGGAFARSHERGSSRAAQSTTTTDQTMPYANNRYRAPVGANPYTHDLPSTDGSDR